MLDSLPVSGWESEQITYQHLIRPVVAFVRDHGPVPVARVCDVIATEAAGDLNFASPTKDRRDAARRALNLLIQDLDALTLMGDTVSAPPGLTVVTSSRFGERVVRPREVMDSERESSRRAILLREWAGRGLFHREWLHGIRTHDEAEVAWMAGQIQTYGYVGPKVVRDAETGAILDGGLRVAALRSLGIDPEVHIDTLTFDNDMHRLAYVLAAHATPGGRTRVPISLRDAVLREVVPRGGRILRTKDGRLMEPTDEEWLAITGKDFPDAAPVQPDKPTAASEDEPSTPEDEPSTPPVAWSDDGSTLPERILQAMLDPTEWVDYATVNTRLAALGYKVSSSINVRMREMAVGNRAVLERREVNGQAQFRRRLIETPGGAVRKTPALSRKDAPKYAPKVGMDILIAKARTDPDEWTLASELDKEVTRILGGPKKRAANQVSRSDRGRITWFVDGLGWRAEEKREDGKQWLRAVPL